MNRILVLLLLILITAPACRKKRSSDDDSGPGGISGLIGATSTVNEAQWQRIQEGTTLAEVEKILGKGRVASAAEMDRLYMNLGGGPRGKTWQQHGRIARVKTWYGWVNGSDAIHVGFFESKKYGELVSAKLAVLHVGGGTLWLELANTPDGLDLTRDRIVKDEDARTNPKWIKGAEARELLVGRWHQTNTKRIYRFLPDGTMTATGDWYNEVTATWRFLDDEHVEFSLPYSYKEERPPPQTYKFVVNRSEMTMWWKLGEYRPHGDFTRLPEDPKR